MRKDLIGALGVLVLGMAGTASASAATINLGTFSDDDSLSLPSSPTYTAGASIDQSYQFTLSETADASVSITSSFANAGEKISGLTLAFDGQSASAETVYFNLPKDTQGELIAGLGSTSPLGPGTYTFTVSGTAGSGSSSYGGDLTLSAVPLPASAPMFGAALVAFGAVGYGLKRKGKVASAS